jgi:Fuc2NAc and GlcNAc transferase
MFSIGSLLLAAAITFGLSRWGGHLLIRNAAQLGLLHEPNDRSSHIQLVPHGGGLAMVLAFALALAVLDVTGVLDWRYTNCLLVAGCLLAGLGLWDDISPLPAGYRLIGQGVAVIAALMVPVHVVAALSLPSWLALGIAALLLLWWINLFNFMDGIDGLAASEALFICAGAALLVVASSPFPAPESVFVMLLLMAALAGFLSLNWPPAQVFMGDVGSTFLGYVLGIFALDSISSDQLPMVTWLVLGSVFWVDSTVTLLRRMLGGERWHSAHRSHAYQRYAGSLARYYQRRGRQSVTQGRASAHRTVTMVAMTINILWLLPLAWLVIIAPSWQLAWLGFAWLPLVWLTLFSSTHE